MAIVFGCILLSISMLMVWPVGIGTASHPAETWPGASSTLAGDEYSEEFVIAQSADFCEVRTRPTHPGFYECIFVDDDGTTEHYSVHWDGSEWSFWRAFGPLETAAIAAWGAETVATLTLFLGGDREAFETALYLLVNLVSARRPQPPPPAAPPAPKAEAEPASSSVNPLTIAPSLNYRLSWSMGSSICGFDGKLTGGLDEWTYSGHTFTAVEGDKDSCYPARNSDPGGTATCTLSGKSVAGLSATDVSMECRASLTDRYGVKLDWEKTFTGRLAPYMISHEIAGVAYSGVGEGNVTVLLEPCAPGKIC